MLPMIANNNYIFPYYYPTRTLFIDDQATFLESLSISLDDDLSFSLYCNPRRALDVLNQFTEPFYQSYFTKQSMSTKTDPEKPAYVYMGLDAQCFFQDQDLFSERFAEVSVVVVDYDMPELSGLELCANIKNPSVKKILFTGLADEKIAIQAFNDGLIDRFLTKQDQDAIVSVNEMVKDLQQSYFVDLMRSITPGAIFKPQFLQEITFISYFHELCDQNKFVEYYLTTQPSGFLFVKADGNLNYLLVLKQAELFKHIEVAKQKNGPERLISTLQSGKFIPYFWQSEDGYFSPDLTNWFTCLHPVEQLITGDQAVYYCALIDVPNVEVIRSSYEHYLDSLDQHVMSS